MTKEIGTIDIAARDYAAAHDKLTDRIRQLEKERSEITRRHLAVIRRLAGDVAEEYAYLKECVEGHPELFEKPRTMIVHGVRVGYRKQPGSITWDSEELVIKRIKNAYPDAAEQAIFINRKEVPVKGALQTLSAADLKKLGVTVTADCDKIVIESTDSDVDKLVAVLLKENEPEEVTA